MGWVEHPSAAATARAFTASIPFWRRISNAAAMISSLVTFTLGGIAVSFLIAYVIYHMLLYSRTSFLSRPGGNFSLGRFPLSPMVNSMGWEPPLSALPERL